MIEGKIKVQQIRLVPVDTAMAEALDRGAVALEAAYGAALGEEFLQHVREVVAQTLALEQSRPRGPVFGGYLVVDVPAHTFVGTCGFRDGPSANGSVELAYGTFPAFEGRGYATAAALEMIALASTRPEVRRIIAHTLAKPGPSPRILEKAGMRHLGEVIDPEDGPVWEFEIVPVRGAVAGLQSRNVTRGLAVGASVFLAFAIAAFGMRRDDYSHLRNTISELGEFGAGDSILVSWGVFFPIGIALATMSALLWRARSEGPGVRAGAALAGCVAAGYFVASFFPCDPGAPLSGTTRQAIHNWGGAIEYFGGAIALLFLARVATRFRWVFAASALVTLAAAFTISASEFADVRGLLQRIAEASLFGSLVLAAGLKKT